MEVFLKVAGHCVFKYFTAELLQVDFRISAYFPSDIYLFMNLFIYLDYKATFNTLV